ncbi:serine/threonine protein kinase [Allobranchiibius sp. GilTou38]|uniref:serine/threonine protein kinase n=1 Tax=Allobranchiibius sp. GilTou38 TaxID=2815210 RepID=UPI001AA14AFB|nr:serine/threonine protein kinase [Allobranchiibius sp. GilTou38]MBO1766974.1 serine/threonine protein kinase [Allobranchiibius sp. GilTou38]
MDDLERRTIRHRAVSAELASWSDRELAAALEGGELGGTGIGGSTMRISVLGTSVFVKSVVLTEAERRPGSNRPTGNVFDLPTWYSWGVGSAGFGAWREVAAHEMTTRWALAGTCADFPLLHHYRVLPSPPSEATPGQRDDIEHAVRFWDGSPAVRRRLEAMARASDAVVLFLEYVPETVRQWFTRQLGGDAPTAEAACALLEHQLLGAVRCMRSGGLTHFDAHFRNLLTDGDRVYVSDFGLAASPSFDVTEPERQFLQHTVDHDLAYVVTELVNTIVTTVIAPPGPVERNDYLRRCVRDGSAVGLPAPLGSTVCRYAAIAVVMNDFHWELYAGRPRTPYPAHRITQALTAAGVLP